MPKQVKPEEATKITFDHNGASYTLEFDRSTVMQTEKAFDISLGDVLSGKLSAFDGLFHGAFLKHHPGVNQTTVENLMRLMPNKQEIFKTLALMFANCVNTLLDEPEEGNAISWTAM